MGDDGAVHRHLRLVHRLLDGAAARGDRVRWYRLGVDAIDVYLSHWPDPATPYEETLGAYAKLLAAGKVKSIGASNLDAS